MKIFFQRIKVGFASGLRELFGRSYGARASLLTLSTTDGTILYPYPMGCPVAASKMRVVEEHWPIA